MSSNYSTPFSGNEQETAASVSQVATKAFNPTETKQAKVVILGEIDAERLTKGKTDQQPSFDPDVIDRLVQVMIKESGIEVTDANRDAVVEKMKPIVLFILENAHQFQDIESDLYLRPRATKLPVPITFRPQGRVIVSLKSKLGAFLGAGNF